MQFDGRKRGASQASRVPDAQVHLMCRYAGVDWRDRGQWECNGGQDPFGGGNAEGEQAGAASSVPLSEALFVPAKEGHLQSSGTLAAEAAQYERWMEAQVRTRCQHVHAPSKTGMQRSPAGLPCMHASRRRRMHASCNCHQNTVKACPRHAAHGGGRTSCHAQGDSRALKSARCSHSSGRRGR